jgi:hypothetical protein
LTWRGPRVRIPLGPSFLFSSISCTLSLIVLLGDKFSEKQIKEMTIEHIRKQRDEAKDAVLTTDEEEEEEEDE